MSEEFALDAARKIVGLDRASFKGGKDRYQAAVQCQVNEAVARSTSDLRSKLAAAETELAAANAQMRELGRQLAEAGEARIAAEASVAQLREALEPFARYAAVLAEGSVNYLPPRCPVHASPQSDPDCATIRVVDLHRAAATFSQSPSDYRERVRREAFEEAAQKAEYEFGPYAGQIIRALGDSNANG